jgi:hypothetical protein
MPCATASLTVYETAVAAVVDRVVVLVVAVLVAAAVTVVFTVAVTVVGTFDIMVVRTVTVLVIRHDDAADTRNRHKASSKILPLEKVDICGWPPFYEFDREFSGCVFR